MRDGLAETDWHGREHFSPPGINARVKREEKVRIFRIRDGLWRLTAAHLGIIALFAHTLASALAVQMMFAVSPAEAAPDKAATLAICTATGLQQLATKSDGRTAPHSGLDHHHCGFCPTASHLAIEVVPFTGTGLVAYDRLAERLSPGTDELQHSFSPYSVKNRGPPSEAWRYPQRPARSASVRGSSRVASSCLPAF